MSLACGEESQRIGDRGDSGTKRVSINLTQISSGSILDEDVFVPPEWELIDIGEVGVDGLVHYRSRIYGEDDIGKWQWDDWPESIIRPKSEVSIGLNTLYKQKGEKVHPASVPLADGSVPEGNTGWEEVCMRKYHTQYRANDEPSPFDQYLKPRIVYFVHGARLSSEREEKLIVGRELWPMEREVLKEMLYKREEVLA